MNSHFQLSTNHHSGLPRKVQDKFCNETYSCYGPVLLGLNESERKVFSFLNVLDSWHIDIWASQDFIADRCGLSREHTHRILHHIANLGLIKIKNRGTKRTCLYYINSIFHNPQIRHLFVGIIAAFNFMPFGTIVLKNGVWQKRAQINDVTQYYNKSSSLSYLYNPDQSSYLPEPVIHERAREGNWPGPATDYNRKKVVMNNQKTPIRESIVAMKQLNLTIYGQIRLSVFPDAALQYGARKMEYSIAAKDKFALLFSICKSYCKDNGLALDWNTFDKLKDEYGYPDNCLMMNPVPASRSGTTAKQKTTPQREGYGYAGESKSDYDNRMSALWNNHELNNGRDPGRHRAGIWEMDHSARVAYLREVRPDLLNPLLKLAFGAPKIERDKKLALIAAMRELSISFEGIISQNHLESILVGLPIYSEPYSPPAPVPDILADDEGPRYDESYIQSNIDEDAPY